MGAINFPLKIESHPVKDFLRDIGAKLDWKKRSFLNIFELCLF